MNRGTTIPQYPLYGALTTTKISYHHTGYNNLLTEWSTHNVICSNREYLTRTDQLELGCRTLIELQQKYAHYLSSIVSLFVKAEGTAITCNPWPSIEYLTVFTYKYSMLGCVLYVMAVPSLLLKRDIMLDRWCAYVLQLYVQKLKLLCSRHILPVCVLNIVIWWVTNHFV